MKTRIIPLIVILLLLTPLVMSQSTVNSKMSFAILGGVNFQNINGKDYVGNKLKNDLIVGYHVGVNAQIPVAPKFFFQPGLLFTTKGTKWTDGSETTIDRLSYIELPLNVVYKGVLGTGYIMIGFGPYIGYAIRGKSITDDGSATVKSDIEFTKVVETDAPLTTCYYKAFDAGGNLFVGYEMENGLFLHLNTQLGMLNINPEDKRIIDDKSAYKNTGFGLSLGYRF